MVKHGIDVSKFQGLIDWQEVKKHIDFAIIRCGYGSDDEKFLLGFIYILMQPMKEKPYQKLNMY